MKIFYITKNYLLKKIELSVNEANNYYCKFPEKVFIMGATEENEAFFNQLNDLEKQFLNTFSPSTLKDSSAIDIEYFRQENTELEFASGLPPVGYMLDCVSYQTYVWYDTSRLVADTFAVYTDVEPPVQIENQAIQKVIGDESFIYDDVAKTLTFDYAGVAEFGNHIAVLGSVQYPDAQFEIGITGKRCHIETVDAPRPNNMVIGEQYDLQIVKLEGDDWSQWPDTRILYGLDNPPPGLTMGVDGENYSLVVGPTWTGLESYRVVCYIRDRELGQEIFRETFEFTPAG